MRTAQGALSVTAGGHTRHSSSSTPRAEGWEEEHLVGLPQGTWWGYGSSETTSWSPGCYPSDLSSFCGGGGGGCLVAKSCLTLCDPMDWSPPGSSVQGIS